VKDTFIYLIFHRGQFLNAEQKFSQQNILNKKEKWKQVQQNVGKYSKKGNLNKVKHESTLNA
jgi:hypothetical protein